jgi:PIN domain nuclease of toxin-antitoxin system
MADPETTILVSSATAWEIATKYRLGKLPIAGELVRDMPLWIGKAGFRELPVTVAHAQRAGSWPQPHRDPFDRMIAAQSVIEQLPIVTRDPAFVSFATPLVW